MFFSRADFCFIWWLLKNVAIYEELKELQFPSTNDFKLEITKSSLVLKDHFDSLLRMSFPTKLFVVSSPSSELLKVILFIYLC